MGRLLVLIVVVVLAVWLIRRAVRRSSLKDEIPRQKAIEGDLIACARCGLNLPRGEARAAGADLYCSDEHAQLGRQGSTSGR